MPQIDRLLELEVGVESVAVGTLYKEMKVVPVALPNGLACLPVWREQGTENNYLSLSNPSFPPAAGLLFPVVRVLTICRTCGFGTKICAIVTLEVT